MTFSPGDTIQILMAVYENYKYTRNEWYPAEVVAVDEPYLTIRWNGHTATINLTEYEVRKQ